MFGKTQRGVSERPNKPKQPLIPKWLGMLVVILIVLSFAVALLLWKPWTAAQPRNRDIPTTHAQDDTNKDYRFYDLLPQQQVTPIPEQAVPETPTRQQPVIVEAPSKPTTDPQAEDDLNPPSAPPQAEYILQVHSFDNPDDADSRRAEIILNGLSADVVQSSEGGRTWYRVVSGPYDSQNSAVIAQQTLQHSGIDSIVVKR